MKHLTLIRHAKSSWKEPGQPDFERPLNKRGERDAPDMGRRLAARNLAPDLLLSSPARRAITTANIIAQEIGYPADQIATDAHIYEASLGDLLHIVQNIDDRHEHVFLFGHNPGFTAMASFLSNHHIENLPTCGVFSIDFAVDSWQEVEVGGGTLAFFDYPKNTDTDD